MAAAPLKLAFVTSDRPEAREAMLRLAHVYGNTAEDNADVVVALGGDGFMLEILHRNLASRRPIYGMNRGSVGFLMNDYGEESLIERIAAAEEAIIHPRSLTAIDNAAPTNRALPLSHVSRLAQTARAATRRILFG